MSGFDFHLGVAASAMSENHEKRGNAFRHGRYGHFTAVVVGNLDELTGVTYFCCLNKSRVLINPFFFTACPH